jgi:hypothetical protein
MKKTYIVPSTQVIFANPVLMNTDSDGWDTPETSLGKESDFEEEETPLYQNNSIWGEEEKED